MKAYGNFEECQKNISCFKIKLRRNYTGGKNMRNINGFKKCLCAVCMVVVMFVLCSCGGAERKTEVVAPPVTGGGGGNGSTTGNGNTSGGNPVVNVESSGNPPVTFGEYGYAKIVDPGGKLLLIKDIFRVALVDKNGGMINASKEGVSILKLGPFEKKEKYLIDIVIQENKNGRLYHALYRIEPEKFFLSSATSPTALPAEELTERLVIQGPSVIYTGTSNTFTVTVDGVSIPSSDLVNGLSTYRLFVLPSSLVTVTQNGPDGWSVRVGDEGVNQKIFFYVENFSVSDGLRAIGTKTVTIQDSRTLYGSSAVSVE